MTLRVGVIGAGAWGLNHIRVVATEARASLVAVAEPDHSAAQRVHALFPTARVVSDAEQLFAAADIDAVVIASPAPTHAALALAAMRAGKHVLVEKPMAMSIAEADALLAAERSQKRVAMVGHLMVFHPAVVRLREILQSGALGDLHYLQSTRVNLGRLRRDENALWSFGPHDLSMFQFLTGKSPCNVAARGQSILQAGIEDVVFLSLRYATGEMAHLHLSWLNPRKERRLTLIGSRKMAEFDDVSSEKLRVFDKGYDRPPDFTEYAQYLTLRDGDVFIPQVTMREPLRVQFEHFIECCASGACPLTSVESAAEVTRTLVAAQRSLASDGVPVEI